MMPMRVIAVSICLLLMVSGCGDSRTADKPAASTADKPPVMPADPELATTYRQTCFACHGRAQSGAPVSGDAAAWQPRMAKGMDELLNNTLHGYRGMPPLGACMDCSDEEFEALITFMATPAP